MPLPCFKPDDLYSYHARATIARLLPDFLARNKVTVTELLHRADLLERLEATGTLYQHAIQKVAVAQAASTQAGVQQIVKSLNELTTKALSSRLSRPARRKIPRSPARAIRHAGGKARRQGDGAYLFNGALARHLKDTKSWDEKVFRLLTIMETAPKEDMRASWCCPRSMRSWRKSWAVRRRCKTFWARPRPWPTCCATWSISSWVRRMKAPPKAWPCSPATSPPTICPKRAPRSPTASSRNSRAANGSPPDSLVEELKALRSIANRIVMGVGKYLSP